MERFTDPQYRAMEDATNGHYGAGALTTLRLNGWELVRRDPPEAGPRTVTVGLHLTDENGWSHTFHQYTVPIPDPKPQPTLADATIDQLLEALRLRHTTTPTPTIESEVR